MARLLSIFVGSPRHLAEPAPWQTSFFKKPVEGFVWLGDTNLAGDAQADLSVHGGPDKAVCVYPAPHYDRWAAEIRAVDAAPGWFGENFSITGETEETVCIGDVFRVGTARVQVSQPRSPCWKLARRWDRPDLPKRVVQTGRSGWYFRVLLPGWVWAACTLALESRPWPDWTIARVNRVSYGLDEVPDLEDDRRSLARCTALADQWRAGFLET